MKLVDYRRNGRKQILVPSTKKGDKHDPENYLPVSLNSIICTIYWNKPYLNKRNQNFLRIKMPNSAFYPVDQRFYSYSMFWTNGLNEASDNGAHVDAICCDFMKTFDTVPHQEYLDFIILHKKLVKQIEDFLSERKQRVTVNDVFSKWHDVISGAPQATVLSSVLFVAYINTLPD